MLASFNIFPTDTTCVVRTTNKEKQKEKPEGRQLLSNTHNTYSFSRQLGVMWIMSKTEAVSTHYLA